MVPRIDPWSGQQYADYARLRDEFGIAEFTLDPAWPDPPPIFRRGVVFGHRGFERVARAIRLGEPWTVLTGLMPSGNMHVGHKMVIDQVKYFQALGADVAIAVADLEAYATRGMSLERCRELALDEYVANYIALGLDPARTRVYFQSENEDVKNIGVMLGARVNWTTFQALYGFDGETTLAHAIAPLVQVGDILHPQLPKHGGARPVLVPVGVDQDPHIRLTRDLAAATRLFSVKMASEGPIPAGRKEVLGVFVKADADDANLKRVARRLKVADADAVPTLLERAEKALGTAGFGDFTHNVSYRALYVQAAAAGDMLAVDEALARLEQSVGEPGFLAPAATYHRFMSGFTGGKMSSSKPDTSVFLSDPPGVATKKLRASLTGGRATADEQRRLGANPDACPVYELYVYHLMPVDTDLADIRARCSGGKILCGECKGIAVERMTKTLTAHQGALKTARPRVDELLE